MERVTVEAVVAVAVAARAALAVWSRTAFDGRTQRTLARGRQIVRLRLLGFSTSDIERLIRVMNEDALDDAPAGTRSLQPTRPS